MKCISLWQPWAALLVHGEKRVETRGWPIRHRGPLLIHAAKTWNGELAGITRTEPFASVLRSLGVMWSDANRPALPFGAIVGRVDVVACVPTGDVGSLGEMFAADTEHVYWPDNPKYVPLQIGRNERAFGDYGPGRFAWVCANPVAFARPVPYRGAQGLFDVPDDLVKEAA